MATDSKIVDYLDRPIEKKALTQELATPSLAGVRTMWYDSIANTLTPERLATIIASVDQNDIYDYLTLADEMEERDLHYHAVLGTRRLATSQLKLTAVAVSDEKEDVEIADFVNEALQDDCVPQLLSDLLDALGKGYAVSEIIWDTSEKQWLPREYKRRDQRFFQFDRVSGEELRLRDNTALVDGLPLAPHKFIQHRPSVKTGMPIRCGLARLAVVSFMCKNYTVKDWMSFAEVFGMPLRVGKYDAGATKDQKAALLTAVSSIGTDAACIVPTNMQIEFVERSGSSGGDVMFKNLADWLDAQVSKGVLGQTMTTDNGSSLSQARVHNEVRLDIRDDDALKLATTLRRMLVRPIVDLNFGPRKQGKYPRVKLGEEQPEDLKLLADSLLPFVDHGLPVEVSVILDKFGLEEPAKGAQLLQAKVAPAPFGGGEPPAAKPAATPSKPSAKPNAGKGEDAKPNDSTPPSDDLEQAETRRLALARGTTRDGLDEVVDEALKDWRELFEPVVDPVLALAQRAKTAEEFKRGLDELRGTLRVDDVVLRLATATLEARGLGDVFDKV